MTFEILPYFESSSLISEFYSSDFQLFLREIQLAEDKVKDTDSFFESKNIHNLYSNFVTDRSEFVKFINSNDEALKLIDKIGKDLSNSFVRLEVICDREGFWLKPHCDIEEKLMSSIVFVNLHNEPENLGTDFYDSKLNKVKTVPYKHNYGYFFTSGPNTWHGMEKKEIKKERRCIQIIYVTFQTDWKVNS